MDWNRVRALEIDPYETITEAELVAIVSGKPNDKVKELIGLERIKRDTRIQTIVFRIASTIYNAEKQPNRKGDKEAFLVQLVRLVEEFMESDKITIKNDSFDQDDFKRKVLIMLNMNKVIQHVRTQIREENKESLTAIFDREKPIRSTGDMRAWYTSRPCERVDKSHVSHCVYDSGWEASEAYFLERSDRVRSFVKNDHLGFFVLYNFNGVVRRYYPDFLIRLTNGEYLILETKGVDDEQNKAKREALNEWVEAVNVQGGFGKWHCDVSFHPSDMETILRKVPNP